MKVWLLLASLALALPLQADPSLGPINPVLAGPAEPDLHNGQRLVVYDQGQRQVQVPAAISRVATVWEAQNSALALLGFGPKIVATTRYAREMPAMRKLIPGFEQVAIASTGSGDLNMEELLRLKPQVLFTATHLAPVQEQQLRNAGIAVAGFRANALPALRERMDVTAEILGPEAQQRAQHYRAYFDDNIRRVSEALADVPAAQQVSIYHAVGEPLKTSGRPSLNQDWMDLAHVRNVAEHWFEGGSASAQTSIEALLQADPDIIVAMRASDAQSIRNDPRWRRLSAVKNQRVYANPRGMFWWGRETPEVALQFLWLATVAYPEAMQHIDMRAETRAFYQTFYGYTLSDAELSDFLQPQSP